MSKLNSIKDNAKFLADMYKYTDYNMFDNSYNTPNKYYNSFNIEVDKETVIRDISIAKRQLKLERILK